jgi:hypothetical protein
VTSRILTYEENLIFFFISAGEGKIAHLFDSVYTWAEGCAVGSAALLCGDSATEIPLPGTNNTV